MRIEMAGSGGAPIDELAQLPQAATEDGRGAHAGAGELTWWQHAVIYQIYPRSFQDSDGDGIGDLAGILARVDHLARLGVDAVWLSPIYPSPMLDFGYDIADFTGIDPVFGTMETFDRLVAALHERGIRLIVDFVPNHTSDQHPWFKESRASRDNPKREWYVWHDPAPDGGPPNNWLSRFGGSAWDYDEATGQYYYHAFLKAQPDLNWWNPEVKAAMADLLRFWMKRGADGFRMDASAVLLEDDRFRDDPPNPDFEEGKTPPPERLKRVYTDDRPETLAIIEELRGVIDEFPDRVLLGETQGATERIGAFDGKERPALHLPLNFALMDAPWSASELAHAIEAYLDALPDGAWPDWVIGSHDKPRIASRMGQAQARIAAMLAFTLPGTPILYAGDEIGVEIVPVPSEEARDPFERLVPGYDLNRDPERAPMRWNGGRQAGFTTGTPWLPVGEGIAARNVAVQEADARSMLALYRQLIAIRKAEPVLLAGECEILPPASDVLAFRRHLHGEELLVLLNTGNKPQRFSLPRPGQLVLTTHLDRESEGLAGTVELRPDEGLLIRTAHF
ncbi:alpha-amylase family glycosyl hydrolase [Chelatococcus sp. GCM10030263]|uniref:alpha-amylase family glycosyl hydrolase n=1 Tax=Chelatococcus sp. GCM10030263 TaxID=3273387 RepID=UPI0036186259